MPYLQDSALDTMCGGISHRRGDFAFHLLNATVDLPRMRRKSIATFFVDVIAALDSVLHPSIVDLVFSDDSIFYFKERLNLPGSVLQICVPLSDHIQPSKPLDLQNIFVALSQTFLPMAGFL